MLSRASSKVKSVVRSGVGALTSGAKSVKDGIQSGIRRVGKRRLLISAVVVAALAVGAVLAMRYMKKKKADKNGELEELPDTQTAVEKLKSGNGVLVYAPWCPHCAKAKPIVSSVAKSAGLKVYQIDGDEKGTAEFDDFEGYPTLYLRGKSLVGLRSNEEVRKFITDCKSA